LDIEAWSSAHNFITALNHFLPETKICRAGDFDCWAHRAFLFNLDTHAHRDVRDYRLGYAVIVVFGAFTGGEFVIPGLNIKFPFQPGDVIFIRGQALQHYITQWEPEGRNGERFCITHFTHQSLVDYISGKLSATSNSAGQI
jgi:Oxygenase domain of the 2OGFeDO superfamily